MDIVVYKSENKPIIAVLRVAEEINMASFPKIDAAARAEISSGTRNVVIDLTGVPYMTSAGIRLLNGLFKLLRQDTPAESDEAISQGVRDGSFHSPHLKLVNPNASVREVLKTSGMDMLLAIYPTVEEAVASFG
jgi:anti-anti-sigma regulatory factor